jgi:hypothetical protein
MKVLLWIPHFSTIRLKLLIRLLYYLLVRREGIDAVRVLYDYKSQAREELDIRKDQIIPVTATHEDGYRVVSVTIDGGKDWGMKMGDVVKVSFPPISQSMLVERSGS